MRKVTQEGKPVRWDSPVSMRLAATRPPEGPRAYRANGAVMRLAALTRSCLRPPPQPRFQSWPWTRQISRKNSCIYRKARLAARAS